jgi:hypothetical protein
MDDGTDQRWVALRFIDLIDSSFEQLSISGWCSHPTASSIEYFRHPAIIFLPELPHLKRNVVSGGQLEPAKRFYFSLVKSFPFQVQYLFVVG